MTLTLYKIDILEANGDITPQQAGVLRAEVEVSNAPRLPEPQPGPQTQFLESEADIVIYGGAAGGGKTFSLLLDFARPDFISNPAYGFVIFRRTSPQITNEGGLWDASQIYRDVGAYSRVGDHSWHFPSGCSGRFTHLVNEDDKYAWQGSEITRIGFDELTHFTEGQFFYLLSRNRSTCGIRPQVRATCNPQPGWVKKFIAPWIDKQFPNPAKSGEVRWFARIRGQIEWVDPDFRIPVQELGDVSKFDAETIEEMRKPKSVTFIRSSVYDNPALVNSNPSYLANLLSQSAVERSRLLDGDWDAFEGSFFDKFSNAAHVVTAWHTPKTVDGPLPPQWWTFFGGFDWGYADPSAFVLAATDENGAVHGLESWEVERETNDQLADRVCATLARWGISKNKCDIVADGTMWNRKTFNGVPAEADVEAFHRAGLRMVKADVGAVANRHRNSAIRAFIAAVKKFFLYRGYNNRLVECLESAQPDPHDNEQVLHNEFSHLIVALGNALSLRPKPSDSPVAALTPEEEAVKRQRDYEETMKLARESQLRERNKRLGIVPKKDESGEEVRDESGALVWVAEPKRR
jgi:hypothetical protein